MILDLQKKTGGSVRQICRILQLPRSSFYTAQKPTSTRTLDYEIGADLSGFFSSIESATATAESGRTCRKKARFAHQHGSADSCGSVGLRRLHPGILFPGPVMAGPTNHRLTCS